MLRQELLEELKSHMKWAEVCKDIYGAECDELATEEIEEFLETRKNYPHVLTLNETNRVIEHRVPMEMRIKAVYIPILSSFVAMRKFQQAVDILTRLRPQTVKKIIRRMKDTISEYDMDIYRQMKPELYGQIQRVVDTIMIPQGSTCFSNAGVFLNIFDNTLYSEAEEQDASYEDLTDVVVKMLGGIELCKYIMDFDREYANYINEACGKMVTYTYKEDKHIKSLMEDAIWLVDVIDLPELLTPRALEARDKLFSVIRQLDVEKISEY